MTRNATSALMAAFLALFSITAIRAEAQDLYWIQIEANPTLTESQRQAGTYDTQLGNIAGFQLSSGWYALAHGPFTDEQQALTQRRMLLNQRAIPDDAFVTTGEFFRQRFWPVGGDISIPITTDPDTGEEFSEAEPEIIIPETDPEETLAEARRSEAQLSREERAALQVALQWKGFYGGSIDAAFGPMTRRSMSDYQAAKGLEATGVLTTRQRAQLLDGYRSDLATLGMDIVRDEDAGVEIQLPLGMMRFDRYDPPFVHFDERDESGVRALLISQAGTRATLFGLYEIMQTLEIVPTHGERQRGNNSFTLTGQSDTLRSHTYAAYRNGQVKGYTLIWTPGQDALMARVLPMMESSFETFGGALPDTAGAQPSATQRRDLISGLEVRRPTLSRTGFFVDASGRVLTTAEAVNQCERVTLDEAHEATVAFSDERLGIALLAPTGALAPLAHAEFLEPEPRLMSEIVVAGFSFEDLLTRPVLTFGTLEGLAGLNGETGLRRLSIEVLPGDAGGPVFDSSGAVLGMLLPRGEDGTRVLPPDVHFAVSAQTLSSALDTGGIVPSRSNGASSMPPEVLTGHATDMTVLVSCWN